jgi:hypothetical protein
MAVYFIQAGAADPIKIGSAKNPQHRLQTLQIGAHCSLRLIARMDGGEAEERALHRKFSHLRLRGEWFKPGPELLAFIAPFAVAPSDEPDRDDLIGALGGSRAVAEYCGVSGQVVSNWRNLQRGYGISREYRPTVAAMAAERGVSLPEGFLAPRRRIAA